MIFQTSHFLIEQLPFTLFLVTNILCVHMCVQSCSTLCDPMDCSLAGSSGHGIFPARILEWVAFPSAGDLPTPGIELSPPALPVLAGGFFT